MGHLPTAFVFAYVSSLYTFPTVFTATCLTFSVYQYQCLHFQYQEPNSLTTSTVKTIVAFPQSDHLAYGEGGRGNDCPRGASSVRKGPTCLDVFSGIQSSSERFTNQTPTSGLGPKKPQPLQPSIADKSHQPSHGPQRK